MQKPTSDERVLAALAHASILFSFFGPIGSILVWVSQRTKSKYVRFHALQAMGYQVFSFWAFLIGIFVLIFAAIPLTILVEASFPKYSNPSVFPFILQPIIFLGILGLMGIFFLYGFAGAVLCMMDRDFSYLIIGNWLKKKLFGEQITDDQFVEREDNWVSGICHATAIMRLLGLITPAIVWFTQKERSAKIRFQSLQAIFYQGTAIVVGIVTYVVMMVFYFMLIGAVIAGGVFGGHGPKGTEMSPVVGIIFLVFMVLFMIFWLISMLVVPIYYILSVVAGISTMRGHDFKYPILGRIVSNRLPPQA